MIFLNSSIVLIPKPGHLFNNYDPETSVKKYTTEVVFEFNPNKLKFQVDAKLNLLSYLKDKVIEYCDKYIECKNLQAIGVNFLLANIELQYEIICKKFIVESSKLPKFQSTSPDVHNISSQYKISKNEIFNFKIHRAENTQKNQQPIPVFDINIHHDLNNISKDHLYKIIKGLPDRYNQMEQFIGSFQCH